MREAAPFGRAGQDVSARVMIGVQSVIEAGDHARGIAKRGMLGDFADAFAVNPDFPPIVKTIKELLARVRQDRPGFRHGSVLPDVCPDF